MTKQIGILTRHCYPNYGSILQTYALQSALKELGATPVVLDYISEDDTPLGLVWANLRVSKKGKSPLSAFVYFLVQTPTFFSMFFTFRRHQKRLLNLSVRVKDADGLARVAKHLDLAVAGSDQIWNRIIDSIDMNYFLPFMQDRSQRVSYAASLGSVTPLPEDQSDFLQAIRTMRAISVREPSSAKWINEQGVEARADVDPVLLHGRRFWEEFASERTVEGPYILVYQLHKSDFFDQKLKEIKSKYGLPVFRVSPDWKHVLRPGRAKILVSPESFLSWIRNAECVVTDSFHGTSFSLKFGRPVYVIPPGKYSARLTDVMARVGLEHMVITSGENETLPDSPEYDAEAVNELLEAQAADSWNYLRAVVEEKTHVS